jgi:chemotaxis signal transduction protein
MAISTAWTLDFENGFRAAVGELEMVHLIQFPTLIDIPHSPFYCRHVLIWQENIIPVMDLGAWLNGHYGKFQQPLVGIFAYQERADTRLHYGALLLAAIPRRLRVSDEQACDLPTQPTGWKALAFSCFSEGDKALPILNLQHIFSGALIAV